MMGSGSRRLDRGGGLVVGLEGGGGGKGERGKDIPKPEKKLLRLALCLL